MRRWTFFILSLLVHLLLLLWILHVSFPIRLAPQGAPLFLSQKEALPTIFIPPVPNAARSPAGRSRGGLPSSPAAGRASPGLPAIPFTAEAASPPRPTPSGKNDLVLPLLPPGKSPKIDFRRYLDPVYAGRSQWPLDRSDEPWKPSSGGTGEVYADRAIIPLDLRPWASQVVKIISQNWVLPQEAVLYPHALVVVRIVIDKEGEIRKSMLQDSSAPAILQEAALASLALSRQLPPLPKEYGQDEVETTLVFQYGR